MRKQANNWTGTFPVILGLTLCLGGFLHSTAARSQAGFSSASNATMQNFQANVPGGPAVSNGTQKQYTGKKISLDLMDADIRNVLRLISQLTSENIVLDPDVSGKVTLKVKDVPWDQVLDMVLSMNGLGMERNQNVIIIGKESKMRQEYQQRMDALKAKQALADTYKDEGELTTVYFPVNFGVPDDLAAKITACKSSKGKVSVDKRTSLIIYTDYPARISNARSMLQRLDRPTPQVLIEARIITIQSEATRTLGVNFSFNNPPVSGASAVNPTGTNFAFNLPNATGNLFGLNLQRLIGTSLVQIDLQIQALQALTEARIVAAPRVLTLDNVKATISSGEEIPYLQVSGLQTGVSNVAFNDVTLELNVTPHITPDRKIKMQIDAKQDTVEATLYNLGNGAQEPGISTRKIKTELLVANGNVVVIGGIINNQSSYGNTMTPGFADIPILGRLFKTEDNDVRKNELLIFISPKIVEPTTPFSKTS